MIGVIRIVCATIIACGVNNRPNDPERTRAREQEIDREPDHDRRQSHQCIEHDDHDLAAGKARERDPGAERQADERGERHRREAHEEREAHDGEERGIAGQHEVEGGHVVPHG
jgi:hypothetical protein